MKSSPAPHEKLTEEQIKDIIIRLESIHHNMSMQMKIYMEMFEENISKLTHHYFPERFSIAEVSMGELTEIFSKSYGNDFDKFMSPPRRMTRPEVNDA